ncbi:MAG: JAB domain-containing protein [Limisphaerales bacterium]
MTTTKPIVVPGGEFKVMFVRECAGPMAHLDTPQQAADYWHANIPCAPWYDPCKEALVVLVLNTRRRILGHNLVALGTLDGVTAHSRETYRPVIALAGHAAIIVHNHPSGDPTPSEADIRVTRDLIRAGQLLNIELLDHLIIGEKTVSLRELGYFA